MLHPISVVPTEAGWMVQSEQLAAPLVFRSGAMAEDAAWRIARREASAGMVAKTDYQAMSVQPLGAEAAAAALSPHLPGEDLIEDTTTPDWKTP